MRRVGDLFRAWPIRPFALAILLSLFQLLVNSAIVIATARAAGRFSSFGEIFVTFPSVFLGFAFGFSSLWITKMLSDKFPGFKTVTYWLGAVAFGASLATARYLSITDQTPEFWKDPASWWRIFFAAILVYLTVHISLGLANRKLASQVTEANAAKTALEIQRRRLISAQEDVRRQIADFLHDRLQSDLVLLGIQMQRSIENLGPEEKAIARAYIDEIERIRQFDVRSVSRQLAPELDGPSLKPALEELLTRYSKAFRYSIQITERGDLDSRLKLGVYRILEQGLLNSAAHAKANEVSVSVEETETEVVVKLVSNGEPLPANLSPGAGFAIFDEWTSSFSGNWAITATPLGTELVARLKKAKK